MAKRMPPRQRALFTFLITTLVAPALAALAVLVGSIATGLIGAGLPGRAGATAGADFGVRMAWAAERALTTFVWSAMPAGLAGAVLAALVWRAASFSWITAAVTCAISATLFAAIGGLAPQAMPIAFLGACVGVAIWKLALRLKLIT